MPPHQGKVRKAGKRKVSQDDLPLLQPWGNSVTLSIITSKPFGAYPPVHRHHGTGISKRSPLDFSKEREAGGTGGRARFPSDPGQDPREKSICPDTHASSEYGDDSGSS